MIPKSFIFISSLDNDGLGIPNISDNFCLVILSLINTLPCILYSLSKKLLIFCRILVNDNVVIDLLRAIILFVKSFKNELRKLVLSVQNFIKLTLFINKISLDVVDITVAGYKFISEKAITSPNKFPDEREDKCITLLLDNIRLISIDPEIIKPILLQGSYSNAIISFLLYLAN